MNDAHSIITRRISLFCGLVLLVWIAFGMTSRNAAHGADPILSVRKIAPPEDWQNPANAERWIRATSTEWKRFRENLLPSAARPPAPSPVIIDAVYRATFQGTTLTDGQFDWTIHRFQPKAGFLSLGKGSLPVSQLKWKSGAAVHGISPTGDWMLWSEAVDDHLTGLWSQRGASQLEEVVFQLALPRSLSSRLEIRVPRGWEARVIGAIGVETSSSRTKEDDVLWKFELGRQQSLQLRLGRVQADETPRILVRESTIYGLTTTDDLIRLRTDLDCTIDGAHHADLLLSVPKTLRVFNVLLGNELPLSFDRVLGSEEDQLRIPLRALTPGQRVTLRILGESQRRSDRSFPVPRLRPLNAVLQEGSLRVAVDRPLELRAVETTGLRQTQLTEEAGQEIRSYEVLSNECRLALQVSEPAAALQGEMLFIADVRGESPVSRVRVRLSTREGELFSPQMHIPSGWDLISVTSAEPVDVAPAAWQVTPGTGGDSLLNLELRQPIRPDRDCTLLMEFKATALKPGSVRRLPVPRLRNALRTFVRGVVWDNRPWELDNGSTGAVELDGSAPDEELIQAVRWSQRDDTQAVPTGIRIPAYDAQSNPLFREEGSTLLDPERLARGTVAPPESLLLCANLEVETRTSRIGKSHPHHAIFRFTHAATPLEFRLTLPAEAELTRVVADEREISFVRRDGEVVLDPAASPMLELVLEYRTAAAPGWIVSRDEVVFPRLDCLMTEFAWHLILDSERMLFRLPITAAVSPREQPRPGERLLGPLARHAGEDLFNPFVKSDWKSLINGTPRAGASPRSNDIWFVAPQIPERLSLKTWNRDVSHGLAWCSFLGSLAAGIGLRRGRSLWFRKGWIYLGGAWLVTAVFVSEPYAPVAGGAFLGSLLALIIPRRFAIGRDWLVDQPLPRPSAIGRAAVATGVLVVVGFQLGSPLGHGQETASVPELRYFEIQDGEDAAVHFDSTYQAQWDTWRDSEAGPPWLLKSSHYDVRADASGPPRITATYEVAVFHDSHRSPLRLPLAGVSLDQVEAVMDGEPVRLIPAADRKGFVLPFVGRDDQRQPAVPPPPPPTNSAPESPTSKSVAMRTVTLKFRPLPNTTENDQKNVSASLPQLPECLVTLQSARWRMVWGPEDSLTTIDSDGVFELGPVGRLDLTSDPPKDSPRENVTDVQLRTLIECGPLGGRVQFGLLASVADPLYPSEVSLTFPPGLFLQSISGPSLEQSHVENLESETRVTLRLRPTAAVSALVQITAFLPVTPTGFRMAPPRWRPQRVNQPVPLPTGAAADARTGKSFIGVIAKPGFEILDETLRASATPISPQTFSDSLFAGTVWQVPQVAWSCRDSSGPTWSLTAVASMPRAQLAQSMTLRASRSEWRLEARVDTTQGVPFEHQFTIDPRIEIDHVSVQQDGADRLLNWTRTGDQVWLGIRNSQPGIQTVRIEGTIAQATGKWTPPQCDYRSGQTLESSVAVRNSAHVISTLKWADSTTRLRPNDGSSDEEVRYRPGTVSAPLTIQVQPMAEEQSARVWVGLTPRRDSTWQVTLRAQLLDSVPGAAPVRIEWDQPGLTEFRLTNRRDNVRQTADGKAYLWRPQAHSSKPAELSLSASVTKTELDRQTIRLPKLSGVVWSEIWVSLPRGAGYRPARVTSTLQTAAPTSWPPTWTDSLTSSREDLFSSTTAEVSMEASASEPLVRPVLAESLIWMEGDSDLATAVRYGVTKYLLIAERDITLEIPDSAKSIIRAIAIDGRTQGPDAPVRVPSRAHDLSHELVVWWQSAAGLSTPDPRDLVRLPGSNDLPHWIGVVPPHQQMLLDHWGRRDPHLPDFWLDRSAALLQAAGEFKGAPWSVDGPLIHDLSESRDELSRTTGLSTGEVARREQLLQSWTAFSQSGGNISSPVHGIDGGMQHSGLDATLALCGESRSLWLQSPHPQQAWPRLLDRRWALIITASLASIVSLWILLWVVRLFRKFEIAEKLAVRPHSTMAGMGLIWWAFLSPSVLGLGLAVMGGGLWIWDRLRATRAVVSEAAKSTGR